MGLVVITPPAQEPVSLADIRDHLRMCSGSCGDDSASLLAYLSAAREFAENYTDRALMTQTLELTLDEFPEDWCRQGRITLPRPPLQSVTSVKYYDSNNALQTLATTKYEVQATSDVYAFVQPVNNETWPETYERANAVAIRYVAGYADKAKVPLTIKQAIRMLVEHWFMYRGVIGDETEIPFSVTSLLTQNKIGLYV